MLVKHVGNNPDTLTLSKTKIHDNFSGSQFLFKGSPTSSRLDRAAKSGGILLYKREDIQSKYLKKITVNESYGRFFVELNLRSKKWPLGWSYNPQKEKKSFPF